MLLYLDLYTSLGCTSQTANEMTRGVVTNRSSHGQATPKPHIFEVFSFLLVRVPVDNIQIHELFKMRVKRSYSKVRNAFLIGFNPAELSVLVGMPTRSGLTSPDLLT